MGPSKTEQQEIFAEAQELIDALGRVLLQLQHTAQRQQPIPPGIIDALFRDTHTLKGLYGLLGGGARVAAAHAAEDLLDAMRMGRQSADAHALELLFAFVEAFAADARQAGAAPPSDSEDVFAALLARTQAQQGAALAPVAHSAPASASTAAVPPELAGLLTAYEAHRFAQAAQNNVPVVVVTADLSLFRCEAQLKQVQERLASLGEVLTLLPSSAQPTPAAADAEEPTLRFTAYVATHAPAQQLASAMADVTRADAADKPLYAAGASPLPGKGSALLDPMPAVLAAVATPDASPLQRSLVPAVAKLVPPPAARQKEHEAGHEARHESRWSEKETRAPMAMAPAAEPPMGQTVRVDIRRLDGLLHWVNELGLTKIALQRMAASLRQQQGFAGLAAEVQRESVALERRVAELQAGVMAVRMVSLAQLFERLVRSGHQIAHELGKEVRFVVRGEGTEVDKFVAEKLVDPLLHLVRNAVDHAIEYSNERRSVGKEPFGTVQLVASTRGCQVAVQVHDDGKGIDKVAVLQAAVERGQLSPAQAALAQEADVWRAMCAPGLSTRKQANAFSGRGVGLDVVKTQLENMGGSLQIGSTLGQGSMFSLSAPLTLAIIPALILTVAAETFAVPVTHVVETVALEHDSALLAQGQHLLRHEGALVPLVYLAQHLALAPVEKIAAAAQYALILSVGGEQLAVAVDDLVGQQDILLKDLGPRLRRARPFAGITELADKKWVLVVDGPALLHDVAAMAAPGGEPRPAATDARLHGDQP